MRFFGWIFVALALAMPHSAKAADYRLLSSFDKNFAYNPHILYPFVDGLKERTKGRINIVINGPETVPIFEQLEPVGSGVFKFLFTHGAYHIGTTPLFMAADALEGDLAKVRASGVFDFLDKHYQKFGVKLVMMPITPDGAYQLILRDPVSKSGGIEGRKIRGSVSFGGVIEMLGGVLAVMPASETYTGLEKGVIDGAGVPIISVLDFKWYEVAKYLLRPGFGANYEPIFMNLDAWNALSAEDKKIMTDLAREIEDRWYVQAPKLWKEEEEKLLKLGMKITEMGDAQKAKLRETWGRSLWTLANDKSPAATKEFQEFARKAGLVR